MEWQHKIKREHLLCFSILRLGFGFLSVYSCVFQSMDCHSLSTALFTGEAIRKGFYIYDDERKASPDPEIKKYIEKSKSVAGCYYCYQGKLF